MSKSKTLNATVWSFLDKVLTQAVSLLIGIYLARLLTPDEYGIVGIAMIFIALSNVFIDSGFGNGLIRKVDRTEADLSTAFYFNIGIGIVFYAGLWIFSPWIGRYFESEILVPLLRVAGLNIIFYSLCIVQNAILTAKLNIKTQTLINLFTQIPAGLLAILFAYKGLGVYALILQSVIAACLRTVLLWLYGRWIPREKFNRNSFKYLFNFGIKLVGANLIGTLFSQVYSVLIGKFIGKEDLGYFTKSNQLQNGVNNISTGIVKKIALPVLSVQQGDKEKLTKSFRDVMKALVMVVAPLSAALCFCADDIILMMWTEKWSRSILLFQILIVGAMWNPISDLSLCLMQVVNRTGLILKLEFPKKATYFLLILLGFRYGVVGLAVSSIFVNVAGALINSFPTKKILDYGYGQQLLDIVQYMLISFAIGYCCQFACVFTNHILNITVYMIIYTVAYVTVLLIAKDDVFTMLLKLIRKSI